MDYLLSEAERSYEYFPETSGKKKKKKGKLFGFMGKKKNNIENEKHFQQFH